MMRRRVALTVAVGTAALLAGLVLVGSVAAQGQPPAGAAASAVKSPVEDGANRSVEEAVKQSKATGKPLLVLGVSEGCSRCQALKAGLASQAGLKLLLTQYVTVEVPFAGREFREMFDAIVKRDKTYNQSIGAPSVFLFTAAGQTVYAGPNQSGGMTAGEELKKLLIQGIDMSGGVRGSSAGSDDTNATARAADLSQARKLLAGKQVVPAAMLVSKHLAPAAEPDEEVAAVMKLTGLPLAKSKSAVEADALAKLLAGPGQKLIQEAVTLAAKGEATRGAVQLAQLGRAFGNLPALADPLAAAWKELEAKTNVPKLREQAELIDKARAAESDKDLARAIATYEEVVATYPDTQAAELSQQRVKQLKSAP